MSDDMDRLDKLQNTATRKKEQKEEKLRRRRETIRYLISLIWDVFQWVLFLLLVVAAIIACVNFGIVARIIVFILSSWFGIVVIKKAMVRNSGEISISDFLKSDIPIFFFVECVLLVIIYLYCKIVYHI